MNFLSFLTSARLKDKLSMFDYWRSRLSPWRAFLAIALAIAAQAGMEAFAKGTPDQTAPLFLAIGLYIVSIGLLLRAYRLREFALPDLPEIEARTDPSIYQSKVLFFAIILTGAAFVSFADNLFTAFNVGLWLAAVALFTGGLWLRHAGSESFPSGIVNFTRRDPWPISVTRQAVLFSVIAASILFFRFYRLEGIPGEPFSDHAEKLLDVLGITEGQTHIFFPRNTGRECIQFYWTAFLSWLLGTGPTFIVLKIGTVLIGLFALPYIYLVGMEVGGKRVALFALILAGTSYWLNTISRIGLRFPLYPAFAAPVLYHLIRGLRRQTRNDFILAGIFLGLGLHGYSSFRFVPLVALLGLALYLLHQQSAGKRRQTLVMFVILVLASFLVFLPLLRYAMENPYAFSYRTLTRLTGEEQPLLAPVWQVFASNIFRAMAMFNYDDGQIWVHSIPHRPALDIVSAALFLIGYVFLLIRYLSKRNWLDSFLILAVPMFLMPSILSLAFPGENPSLNRTGAAAVVVFVIAAMALDGLYESFRGACGASARNRFAVRTVIVLLLTSTGQNYNLVFDQFSVQFMNGAWNTSDMGKVIRSFVAAGNSPKNAFVGPFPYWVDTRLVGMQAGYPKKDYAINRDDLAKTLNVAGSRLVIVKEDDKETLATLGDLYPSALPERHLSPLEGKNFWIYTITDNQTVKP